MSVPSKRLPPWPANEPLPSALSVSEFIRVLNISRSTYHRLEQRGEFDRFKLSQPIGKSLYSGAALEKWRQAPVDRTWGDKMRRALKRQARQGK